MSPFCLKDEFLKTWLIRMCDAYYTPSRSMTDMPLYIDLSTIKGVEFPCNLTVQEFMEVVTYIVDSPEFETLTSLVNFSIEGQAVTEVEIDSIVGQVTVSLTGPVLLANLTRLEQQMSGPEYTDYKILIIISEAKP